jgi:hypothetical protein
MSKKYLFIILVFVASFYSCDKDVETNNPIPTYTDPDLSFLDNAISDSCSENDFYIKGEFNGHKLCFATIGPSGSYFVDTFANAFYIYHYVNIKKDSVTDNLHLIRKNSNNSIMIALYGGQTHILKRTFPYSQPHPNLERCEFTEFQFINNNRDYSIGQNSPQDNYTFKGYTGFGVNLTFTGLTGDNIVEGIFDGTLKTNTGSIIKVTNGKFRIKFVISEINIK